LTITAADKDDAAPATPPPFDLGQIPDLLLEMDSSDLPVRLDWFAPSQRLSLHGQSYSSVTLTAIELRLQMASMSRAGGVKIDNQMAVVERPPSTAGRPTVLAKVIQREYAGADLSRIRLHLQPIYFSHRSSRVDHKELPKLVDTADQISTRCSVDGKWPDLMVTAFVLPQGNEESETAAALRRARAVRDKLVAYGIPAASFAVQAIADKESASLTWRSQRVEISVKASAKNKSGLASTTLAPWQ
jgi:hypothetical protein